MGADDAAVDDGIGPGEIGIVIIVSASLLLVCGKVD